MALNMPSRSRVGPITGRRTSDRKTCSRSRDWWPIEDAAEFESLASRGLDVRVMGTKVGQASGFKMCYASQTKGRYAIFIQSLVAAHKMGFLETLKLGGAG